MKGLITFYILLVLTLSSCKTYSIPVTSFIHQLSEVDSTSLRQVTTIGTFREELRYLATPISRIECIDKNGNKIWLKVSPSIEIRVSNINGHKTIFYLDRTMIYDSTLVGARSRIAQSGLLKSIDVKDILTIEVQDGKKKYRYSNESN